MTEYSLHKNEGQPVKTECNGGTVYHPVDQKVNIEVTLGKNGTHTEKVSEVEDGETVYCQRQRKVGRNLTSCQRKWTAREKYLLTICALLFLASIAFIFVAFIRDQLQPSPCHCHEPPTILSVENLSPSPYETGMPSLTLICNASGHPAPSYHWRLPGGATSHGNIFKIYNLSAENSGKYVCFANNSYQEKTYSVNFTSTVHIEIPSTNQGVCLEKHCIQTAALLMNSMDERVDPCNNFFEYACGNWNKRNIIPEDKSSFNTFEKLFDDLQIKLKALLEEGQQTYDSSATLKAKVLYQSCINESQIELVGDAPLRGVLVELGRWPVIDPLWTDTNYSIEDIIGLLRGKFNAPILIDCWIAADDKNSSVNVMQMEEPALGMPSREYYLHNPNSPSRQAYYRFMTDIAMVMGANASTVEEEMAHVLEFETMLANISKPQNEKHDTGARYKKYTIQDLKDSIPKFDWLRYFNSFLPEPVNGSEQVVVFSHEYLTDLVELLEVTDKRIISNFIIWRLIMGFSPELTKDFQHIRNNYQRVLRGILRDKPRWQKCVEYLNERLGVATGAMFVHDNFPKKSKDTAMEMIRNLRSAFNDLLGENSWMDDETRAVARDKANAMKERIGYPDFITVPEELDRKLEALTFESSQYFENILRVEQFDANRTMSKFRKTVNKDVWDQDPAVVNAFYNPNTNDIVFPAGMLQPPFYSEYFPKSLNYGGIGVVIGHEITHGFDDKGRQFDKEGNMKQWWKNETIEAFRTRTECIINQYSNVELKQINKFIDGRNTQGENIADNGGLKQAYRAYKMWEAKHGMEPLLPGLDLSHDQLFFLNYAQIWCGNMRDEEALQKIRTSVHSPGPIRATVPLRNSEDFARAFSCPLGSAMNPRQKCSVW